jgi:hypothetical protein
MRRVLSLLPLAALATLAAAPAAYSQCATNLAQVTATQIGGSNPLASGVLTVIATDASHAAISYSVPTIGTGLMRPWTVPIVHGAITQLLCLPRTDRTSIPVGYRFTVRDTSPATATTPAGGNRVVLDQFDIAILADTWSLDNYTLLPQANPYSIAANIAPFQGPVGKQGPAGTPATLIDSVTGAVYIVANGALVPLAGNATFKVIASAAGSLFSVRILANVPTFTLVNTGTASSIVLADQAQAGVYWRVNLDAYGGLTFVQLSSSAGAVASLPIADTGDGVTKLLTITYGAPAFTY